MTQQQSDGFTPEEWAMHKAAQIWCEPEHKKKVMDVKFALSIARDLQQAREAERKAILALLKRAAASANRDADQHESLIAATVAWTLEGVIEVIERREHLKKGNE